MAKTKTERLIQILESEEYQRKPQPFMKKDKLTVRAYILGQYGMLQCAANFSTGYGSKNCKTCNVVDNESHRINHCPEWNSINLCKRNETVNFNHIHSENDIESMKVVQTIIAMWDLGRNRNCMKSAD